jgi:AmmeMemoRadiSam system protein B
MPAVAGRFYPAGETALRSVIDECFRHPLGPGSPGKEGESRSISGAVAPHAGYMASGMNAAHVYKKIKEDGLPDAYVIVGPDHHGVPYGAVMCSDPYLTPFGPCAIHEGIAKRLSRMIPDDPDAHLYEHSVEVQIPFIQYIDSDPHIVPVIMRNQDQRSAEKLGTIIKEVCEGYDVIVIASSDLSHYISKKEAYSVDTELLDRLTDKDIDGMYRTVIEKKMSVCGYGPMAAAMYAVSPSKAELLKYSDSQDSLGPSRSGVVGYASVVMYKG